MLRATTIVTLSLLAALAVACSDTDGGGATVDVDAGATPADDAGPTDDDAGAGGCSAASDQLLTPIDAVASGEVSVISTEGAVTTLFVDATAGGVAGASSNPRVYVSLSTLAKVDETDKTAPTSSAWDVAFKRTTIFTNGGQAGPGQGESSFVPGKTIDEVTSADAASASFRTETFLEEDCSPRVDATGAVLTSFEGWYDYNQATHFTAPKPGTWLVKSASGALFKIELVTYFGRPDGTVGESGGRFVVKVEAL